MSDHLGKRQVCPACRPVLEQRIFALIQRVGGKIDQGLGAPTLAYLHANFPNWDDYLRRGTGYGNDGSASPLVVFDSPLGFAAACVTEPHKGPCAECGVQWRAMILNFRFAVWLGHLLGSAAGTGLSGQELRALGTDLFSPEWNPNKYPPATSPHGFLLWAGVGWLLLHEYGHHFPAAALPKVPPSSLPSMPSFARTSVAAELDADLAAYMVLTNRTVAQDPLNLDRPAQVLAGAELAIQALVTTMRPTGPVIPSPAGMPPIMGTHPSPLLRLRNLSNIATAQIELGTMSQATLDEARLVVARALGSIK